MQDAHPAQRPPPLQGKIQPGKMILDHGILLIPGGLIEDGGRPVPLGLPLHGHEGKMGNPHGNPHRRQPVPLQLIGFKIRVPLGHTVDSPQNLFPSVLARHAHRLLCRGIFLLVRQDIDAWNLKGSVLAHGLSDGKGLLEQGAFGQQMPRERHMMLLAPFPYGIAVARRKPLCHMIVKMIPGLGHLFLGQFVKKLRQIVQKIVSVI